MGPQSQQICPFVHIKNKEPKMYSHPHFVPQRIPMGNHKLEHRRIRVNTTSPIVSEMVVVETRKQLRVDIIQSLDASITTIGIETFVMLTMDVVQKGVLIGSVAKLGNGSGGVLIKKKLSRNTTLPTSTTGVVGTP